MRSAQVRSWPIAAARKRRQTELSLEVPPVLFSDDLDAIGRPLPEPEGGDKLAGVALFCVGTASAFGWLLAYYEIPKAILSGVSSWGMGHMATGFFIAFEFLVVGCFLDAIPAIIIVGTILDPLAKAVTMDPVHFAIIGIVSLAFGLMTPPYGLCLMIACAIAGIRVIDA